mgnify:FL=1
MIDPLFADVVIIPSQAGQFYPHKRKCLYCFLYFETQNRYATKCFEHINLPDRKLLQRTYGLNDLPFKNYNRTKKCYE